MNMLRIATVEDDAHDLEALRTHLNRYEKENGLKFLITEFRDGEDIVTDYSADYDLILMDIEMAFLNGMKAAEKIRELDKDVVIIFITNMPQYAIQGYKVNALDYMLKPISYFSFSESMGRALHRVNVQEKEFITIALMLIGGSPGSTAGGLKTTTIAVLLTTAISTFRRRENANLFGRRIDDDVVKNAATISLMYITLCCTGGLIISVSEGLPMLTCLFETASAVGTVGLSLGITPELNLLSRVVLILLMFFGRVGGLTLIFAALSGVQKKVSKLPKEKITVG